MRKMLNMSEGGKLMAIVKEKKKKKFSFLNAIEKVGNKLPHPATIFIILCVGIVILSHVLAKMGVQVTYTGMDRSDGNTIKDMTVSVQVYFHIVNYQFYRFCCVRNSFSCYVRCWCC